MFLGWLKSINGEHFESKKVEFVNQTVMQELLA